jgi:hypothetical protein
VLSPYTYLRYLAFATGHPEPAGRADARMHELLPRLVPEVPTDQNPAKALAWALWNRVPLLIGARSHGALQALVQQVFARVGKTLAIPTGAHPSAIVTGAFEGRHQLGDDVVGLVLAGRDREVGLVTEVLATRIAQIEDLTAAFGDPLEALDDAVAEGIVVWYLGLWVAAYLALLHDMDPGVSEVYERVRATAMAAV